MASIIPQNTLQQSHQPQLLRQLREKSLNLNMKIQKLTGENKQKIQSRNILQAQLTKLKEETQVQMKKHKSLIVLLNELQQTYHNEYLELKQEKEIDQTGLSLFLLIRKTENIKQAQKLVNFMKHILLDKNRGKAKQFIKKSNFIEGQSEIIAKLKSQIHLLTNDNLQCKRKWYTLQEESKSLESHNKLLSIQNERQKTEIKTLYEEYLQKINEAKTKIVSYNETQKQSIINEYLVKQIAMLQQKRVQIEQEFNNLQYHHENLREELERTQVENKELNGFFNQPDQEGTLANKMKKRIEQLRDVVIECKKKNKNTRGSKLNKIIQNLQNHHKLLLESNDFVQMKTRQRENYGSFLQQKPIADFFSKILQEKDQSLNIMREEQSGLRQKIKDLETQKELLLNQISNLEENLNIDGWETKFVENNNWGNTIKEMREKQKYQDPKASSLYGKRINSEYSGYRGLNDEWGSLGNFTFQKKYDKAK